MRYRKLDANGDYTIGTGSDFLLNSPETVAQAILTRLRLWTGEWFLDTTEGTPWMNGILGKLNQGSNPDAKIRSRILRTQGVRKILAYSSQIDPDSRALNVQATIDTIYGTTTISL